MKTAYPQCNNEKDLLTVVQKMVQLRKQEDIPDWINLSQVYFLGRLTFRIPSAFNNVIAGDRQGDTTNDGTYLYQLLNIAGVLKWNRTSLNVSW